LSRPGEILNLAERFFRGTFLSHTFLLILLGAASASSEPSPVEVIILIVVAINFHLFGYIHNDLIDLPLDRLAPLRAGDPLVTGQISVHFAWIFILAQIPTSIILLVWVKAPPLAIGTLCIGYVATILYNIYGKRAFLPFLTDAIQGVAWSSLAMVGVLVAGDPTTLSWIPVGFAFGFIFLINGVHGGLRDLVNDYQNGRMTTSIYLGARPVDDVLVSSTLRLQIFGFVAFAIIIGPSAVAIMTKSLPYNGNLFVLTLVFWLIINCISSWRLYQAVKITHHDRNKALYGHLMPLLLAPLIIMIPTMDWALCLTTLVCFFGPFLVFNKKIRKSLYLLISNKTRPEQSETVHSE
jgi:4-hydroxybenzoate polyprenyltransferase